MAEWPRSPGNQAPRRSEDIPLGEVQHWPLAWLLGWGGGRGPAGAFSIVSLAPDYKNNILKERAGLAHSPLPAKNVDLDKGQ